MRTRDSGLSWLGEIPAHWEITRLKFIARVQTGIALGKDYGGQATSEYPYLRVANVQDGFIDLSEVKTMAVPEQEAASAMLRTGDVLMNEGGDADKLGRGAIWGGSIAPCLHQNHVFALRPESVSSEWLATWTGSEFAKAYFETRAKQSTNLASISSTNLLELIIAVPPDREQHAIVARLARQTDHLDALLASKQRLLDLLVEKRKAVIATAVTRGLDLKVKLRDSGVPWLGEVPAHWRIAGFTKYLKSLVDYRGRTPEKTTSGMFLVTARNVRNGTIDYAASQEFVDPADAEEIMRRGTPHLGDLLFTTEAPLGQVALVDREDVALAQRIIKLDYAESVLLNPYALWWIQSDAFQFQLSTFATGSTALGIKGERLHMLRNLIPPVPEQYAIIEHIARETAKLDAVWAATERTIALLKERRSALIAAAVTGQLDVEAAA